jgi:cobalt-zinc-cadmium efflux system membrane fusion protein
VKLSPEAIRLAGIALGTAGPQPIEVTFELPGEIKLNSERSVDVRPSYAGRVTALHAALGSHVSRGQPLAEILSNERLSGYTVPAPMSGTVVARSVNPGAAVEPGTVLCTVADLSNVWLDFPVYVQHLGRIRRGQRVHVRTEGGPAVSATGTISYVGPLLDVDTRTTYARVVLPNLDGRWQPGRLVTAIVVVERVTVPVAVPEDAIVRVGTGAAVFRADAAGFEVQPVVLGRSDGTTTEVVSGLERDARIVMQNAIWLKAELEKEAGGDED